MRQLQAQRVLIAYIRRNAPLEYAVWRRELRNEFAVSIASVPDGVLRSHYGQIYRNSKAAMVIATARYISANNSRMIS